MNVWLSPAAAALLVYLPARDRALGRLSAACRLFYRDPGSRVLLVREPGEHVSGSGARRDAVWPSRELSLLIEPSRGGSMPIFVACV